MNRIKFLQQELSYLQKQITKQQSIQETIKDKQTKYNQYRTEKYNNKFNQLKNTKRKSRQRKHIHNRQNLHYEKEHTLDIQYSNLLQKFMSVYEYEIKNTSDHMIFFELKKALHTYLQDTAIKAFEAVLNLDLKEFNVLKWLFNQNTFRDV